MLTTLREERLVERARELGNRAQGILRERLAHDRVVDVRGAGLMIGIELDSAATALAATRHLLRRGFVVVTGGIDGATLTLTPPLTITDADIASLGAALREGLDAA